MLFIRFFVLFIDFQYCVNVVLVNLGEIWFRVFTGDVTSWSFSLEKLCFLASIGCFEMTDGKEGTTDATLVSGRK